MLNLTVGMLLFKNIAALVIFAWLSWPAGYFGAQAAQQPDVRVFAPASGDVLQGLVTISGTTNMAGFSASEISFGYKDDPTSTWFLIQRSSQPVEDAMLATWDTSMITDGEYHLRLLVFLSDGQVLESIVVGLRVRNYTPVETSTPDPRALQQATSTPTQTPLPDYQPRSSTPTPLPTNPAELTGQDLRTSALRGVGIVFASLLAAGLYLAIRFLFRPS